VNNAMRTNDELQGGWSRATAFPDMAGQ